MKTARVTLSGYYGFQNAGDEAVLAGLVQSLRTVSSARPLELDVLSINPLETTATHGVPASHRYKIGPLIRSIARTDLLLSGGGSLLQDVTSAHGIFYYLAVVRMAQILGKKTMFAAQGIGPLIRPRSRKLVASTANRLSAITVRDTESLALLRDIGVRRALIEVTADPALLLSSEAAPVKDRVLQVSISLRPWHGNGGGDGGLSADLAAEACMRAIGPIRANAIAMQPGTDGPITEQFRSRWDEISAAKAVVVPPSGEISLQLNTLLQTLSTSDLVIGMRLHALILAAAAGVPAVALAYDPKVTAFMHSTGQGDAVLDLAGVTSAALTDMVKTVWNDRTRRAEALQAALPKLRAAAMRNAEVAVGLVYKE